MLTLRLTVYAVKSECIYHLSCALGEIRPHNSIAGYCRKRSTAFSSPANRKNCLDVWKTLFERSQIIETPFHATIAVNVDLGVRILIAELQLCKSSPRNPLPDHIQTDDPDSLPCKFYQLYRLKREEDTHHANA